MVMAVMFDVGHGCVPRHHKGTHIRRIVWVVCPKKVQAERVFVKDRAFRLRFRFAFELIAWDLRPVGCSYAER